MAITTLAGAWLKENPDHQSRLRRQAARSDKAKRAKSEAAALGDLEPIFYHHLERVAHDRLSADLARVAKGVFDLSAFMDSAAKFRGDECLYMPAHRSMGGVASRKMCEVLNGPKPYPDAVARHICGSGHHSCVNPMHLRWGTAADNANDTSLHAARPMYMPRMSDDTRAAIASDRRLPNVVAVEYGIAAAVVRHIQRA